MAIQFPADPGAQNPPNTLSPTSSPVANTENELTYLWNGSVWNTVSGGGSGAVDSIIAGVGIAVDQPTGDVTITNTGGDNIDYSGAAAWGTVAPDGTKGVPGLNYTSSKTGTGRYRISFVTPLPNNAYSVQALAAYSPGYSPCVNIVSTDASYFDLSVFNTSTGAEVDNSFSFAVHALNALPPKGGTGADAWGTFNGQDGADNSNAASFNIKKFTRTSEGKYAVEFITPMPTNRYSVVTSWLGYTYQAKKTTTGFELENYNVPANGNPVYADSSDINFTVHCTNATLPLSFTSDQIEAAINNPGASAWANTNKAEHTTLQGSLNIASIVNSSTGQYTAYFTTPMPNADYSVIGSVCDSGGNSPYVNFQVVSQRSDSFDYATGSIDYAGGGMSYQNAGVNFAVFATNALPPKGGTGTDAWATVDKTISNGPCNFPASFNIDSVTRTSEGIYSVVFASPMPTANYGVQLTVNGDNSSNVFAYNKTTTGFTVGSYYNSSSDKYRDSAFALAVNCTNATLPSTFTAEEIQSVIDANPKGIAKAWFMYHGTNEDLLSSYGIAAVTKVNATMIEVTFETPFADTNYVVASGAFPLTIGNAAFTMQECVDGSTRTTSSIRFYGAQGVSAFSNGIFQCTFFAN